MLNFLSEDYLDRYPDYILHPLQLNLNPNKICYFMMGGIDNDINSTYGDGENHYKEWLEVAWNIQENITFWIRILTFVGKNQKK